MGCARGKEDMVARTLGFRGSSYRPYYKSACQTASQSGSPLLARAHALALGEHESNGWWRARAGLGDGALGAVAMSTQDAGSDSSVISVTNIRLDTSRSLAADPRLGHNRWHPNIQPIAHVSSGEVIELDTRDALDVQIFPGSSVEDLINLDARRAHPLTGPIAVRGAQPGDEVEIEILDIEPEQFGYTAIVPGLGLLSDRFTEPFLVKWRIVDGVARSDEIPGVAIKGQPFLGIIGVAPSPRSLAECTRRESDLAQTGVPMPAPDPISAVPATGPAAEHGLRTAPPRENGGNMDVRQLGRGSRLRLRVDVPDALVSVGDAHFAQGDGESCGVAIEISAHVRVRFVLHKVNTLKRRHTNPCYEFSEHELGTGPRRFVATTGIPVDSAGQNHYLDVLLASKNALSELIDHLVYEYRFSAEQAYIIVSVAADLRISSIVNVPNAVVSAILPLDIFEMPNATPPHGSPSAGSREWAGPSVRPGPGV